MNYENGDYTVNERKNTYETTFVVNASLDDAQIETVIGKVQDVITKNQGDVVAVQRWGRKRLAYSIAKKNNGFYVCIEFQGPGDVVTKLARSYHLEENILRYLTIQLTKKALKARQAGIVEAKGEVTTSAAEQVKAPPVVEESDTKSRENEGRS